MTTDKNEAIRITEYFLEQSEYIGHEVDLGNIQDEETLWYVPFKQENPITNSIYVGAYSGLIVDKYSKEYVQPGSGLSLEDWMYAFKIGIRGYRLDLIIEKIYDHRGAIELLDQLKMQSVKMELEGDIEWKIPRAFHRKDIKKRLEHLPCTFKNQSFSYSKVFKELDTKKVMNYRLVRTSETYPNVLGELMGA